MTELPAVFAGNDLVLQLEAFSPEALAIVGRLHRQFNARRLALLAARDERQTALNTGKLTFGFRADTATIREDDKTTWKFEEKWSSGSNILGLIVAALVRYYDVTL
jgi:malate synthase